MCVCVCVCERTRAREPSVLNRTGARVDRFNMPAGTGDTFYRPLFQLLSTRTPRARLLTKICTASDSVDPAG